jgi:TonB family protein
VQEAVSQILIDRARETEGISRMVAVSLFAHAVFIAALVVMPQSWRTSAKPVDVTPMMITLSGAIGPDAGGRTPIAASPVQTVAVPDAPKLDTRPAPKVPEMVAPDPKVRPLPKVPPKPDKPADTSSSRRPTAGPEIRTGSAPSNTGGAAIPFGGLATGGGSPGQGAFTDYANFCCPEYLNQMTDLIKRQWNKNQGATGKVQAKFTIRRDGIITNIEIEKPSDIPMLDLESRRALTNARQLPPLPREFSEPTLTVHLIFEYQR